jgi:hypothetical protein
MNAKKYDIVVEYYRTTKDIEARRPARVGNSGFSGLTYNQALVCQSKMTSGRVCGMIRCNAIVESN